MNDCVDGDMRDALPDLVNGTLSAGDAARVQEHVRGCVDCAAEVELLRTARSAMRIAPTMDTSRIADAVRASTAGRRSVRLARARALGVAGLTLGLLLGAVAVWSARDAHPTESDKRAVASNDSAVSAVPADVAIQPRGAEARAQLALGGDMSDLREEELLALIEEIPDLEAIPAEEASSLDIEPVVPVTQENL